MEFTRSELIYIEYGMFIALVNLPKDTPEEGRNKLKAIYERLVKHLGH